MALTQPRSPASRTRKALARWGTLAEVRSCTREDSSCLTPRQIAWWRR